MAGACLSPESTVTSLLSGSGHLGSSLALLPECNTTFRYKRQVSDAPVSERFFKANRRLSEVQPRA